MSKSGIFGFMGKKNKAIFGEPLDDVLKRTKTTIPLPLQRGVDYVQDKGMHVEGLYRVSGNQKKINDLQKEYDRGEDPDLSRYGLFVVSGMIKNFFSLLPEPLMTYSRYDKWMEAQKIKDTNQKLSTIKNLVWQLPENNRRVLAFLISHLNRVTGNKIKNKMTVQNLAIVFGPTLFRSTDDTPLKIISDTPSITSLVMHFMLEYNYIFNKNVEEPEMAMAKFLEEENSRQKAHFAKAEATLEAQTAENDGNASLKEEEEDKNDQDDSDIPMKQSSEDGANVNANGHVTTDSANEVIGDFVQERLTSETNYSGADTENQKRLSSEQKERLAEDFGPVESEPSPVVSRSRRPRPGLKSVIDRRRITVGNQKKLSMNTLGGTGDGDYSFDDLAKANASYEQESNDNNDDKKDDDEKDHRKENENENTQDEEQDITNMSNDQFQSVLHAVDVGLDQPLEGVQRRISLQRRRQGRSYDISNMSYDQVQQEKSLVKRELRNYDKLFAQKYGREPNKNEKEPLRPLYHRYKQLKREIPDGNNSTNNNTHVSSSNDNNRSDKQKKKPFTPQLDIAKAQSMSQQNGSNSTSANDDLITPRDQIKSDTSGGTSSPVYKALKAYKRSLWVKLHDFQEEFEAKNGRKVMYRSDREPMEQEYTVYKKLRSLIQDYDQGKHPHVPDDLLSEARQHL
eukprot:gb/GECH01000920.1/.p1 GENE.gb/GECH01000920.1/~~gb/GECH01000920.1/.p1  ORF type:complete len:682 (+),score=206.72 gb/GECH01000920.1/:1-2046(+)